MTLLPSSLKRMTRKSHLQSEQLDALAGIAERAAKSSRDLLLSAFGKSQEFQISGEDIKLKEDRASQALILADIQAHSDLPILSEEAGWVGEAAKPDQPYWVIDPLDGSYNFFAGIPLFAVSIAVCIGPRPLLGCVYDVLRDEMFTGGRDRPLRVNNRPLPKGARCNGVLATGLPVARQHQHPIDLSDPEIWRKQRMIGSAALSLAWVASGRFGGYQESGIRWWDVAGGLALVEAAGGTTAIAAHEADTDWTPEAPLNIFAKLPSEGVQMERVV